jgi:hypothetical protein
MEKTKSIKITDAMAVKLVCEHAPRQRRSLANCAAAAIIAALSGGDSNKNSSDKQEESEAENDGANEK